MAKKKSENYIVETNIAEVLTGSSQKPEIHFDNKEFVKAFWKVHEALKYWKWVDRDDIKLNKEIRKIRREL